MLLQCKSLNCIHNQCKLAELFWLHIDLNYLSLIKSWAMLYCKDLSFWFVVIISPPVVCEQQLISQSLILADSKKLE